MRIARVTKITPKYDSSVEIYNTLPCTKESYEFIRDELKVNPYSKDVDAVLMVDPDGNWMVTVTIKNELLKKRNLKEFEGL